MTQRIDSLVDPQKVVAPAATQSIGLGRQFNNNSSLKRASTDISLKIEMLQMAKVSLKSLDSIASPIRTTSAS